jgi:metallophosphoesterase superfamily enzyme
MEAQMIIHHSKKILEQLSEIEDFIRKIERYMDETGIDGNRDKLLQQILENQEVLPSWSAKK